MSTNSQTPIPVPQVPILSADIPLFTSINTFVHTYMAQYDNSHDYQHILRVLSNTHRILQAELASPNPPTYNPTILFLAALLHDVGDHKYAQPGVDTENQISIVLKAHGATDTLAATVQTIVKNVSYTHEVRNPGTVLKTLEQHPELGIVQDADRLDAIGAVGVGRCFSFGAAKYPGQGMGRAVDHFEEKLCKLEGMMKTVKGREMARRRTEVLEEFRREWMVETELSFEMA